MTILVGHIWVCWRYARLRRARLPLAGYVVHCRVRVYPLQITTIAPPPPRCSCSCCLPVPGLTPRPYRLHCCCSCYVADCRLYRACGLFTGVGFPIRSCLGLLHPRPQHHLPRFDVDALTRICYLHVAVRAFMPLTQFNAPVTPPRVPQDGVLDYPTLLRPTVVGTCAHLTTPVPLKALDAYRFTFCQLPHTTPCPSSCPCGCDSIGYPLFWLFSCGYEHTVRLPPRFIRYPYCPNTPYPESFQDTHLGLGPWTAGRLGSCYGSGDRNLNRFLLLRTLLHSPIGRRCPDPYTWPQRRPHTPTCRPDYAHSYPLPFRPPTTPPPPGRHFCLALPTPYCLLPAHTTLPTPHPTLPPYPPALTLVLVLYSSWTTLGPLPTQVYLPGCSLHTTPPIPYHT